MHVGESPGVGRNTAHPSGLLTIDPLLAFAVGIIAIVVRLIGRDQFAKGKGGSCPRPASVFPLGLSRQAEPFAGLLAQLPAKLLAVVPGDLLHGALVTLEVA